MQVTFEMTCGGGGAAFADDPRGEPVRLLRLAADRIEAGTDCGPLYDMNGNTAGRFSLIIDSPVVTCPECMVEPVRQNPAQEWLCTNCGHAWESDQ